MSECAEQIYPLINYDERSIERQWNKKEVQGIYLEESDFQKPRKKSSIEDKFYLFGNFGFEKSFKGIRFKNEFEINLDWNKSIFLPLDLFEIFEEIELSRNILELKDNWDDEGSVEYKKLTWIRSIKILAECSKNIFETSEKIISTPKIAPGPDGSIDFIWEMGNYKLLVNIPEDEKKQGSFYGEDSKKNHIEGTFEQNDNYINLMLCLMTI